MTRDRRAPLADALRDDAALVSVLGAILVAGLLVVILATIQSSYVPVWEEQDESAHMRQLGNDMADLVGNMMAQVHNRTGVPLVSKITLSDESFKLFEQPKLPNHVEFTPGTVQANLTANKALITSKDGVSHVGTGPHEDWENVEEGKFPISGIEKVLSLRLKIDEIEDGSVEDEAWLNFTNADGSELGQFHVWVEDIPNSPDFAVHHETWCPDCEGGPKLNDEVSPFFQNQELIPYWIDVLAPEYRFDRVLAIGDTPLNMALEFIEVDCTGCGQNVVIDGKFAISYVTKTENGTEIIGGSGLKEVDFNRTWPTGTFTYTAQNTYFPRQTYVVEHGAVIVDQADGRSFFIEPSFDARRVRNVTGITLALPALAGDQQTLSGQASAKLRTTAVGQTSLVANMPQLHVNLTTQFPELWAGYFNDTLTDAGFRWQSNHFNVTAGPDYVDLWINGLFEVFTSDPEKLDLAVTFKQATLDFRIET